MCCTTVRHWYNNIDNQLDATITVYLIPISSTCFRRRFRPSSGTLDCVYSLCYNAPTVLPSGSQDAVPPNPGYRPATSWVHYTTSCKHSLLLLRMDKIFTRNMLSWLGLINRYSCIYLVVYIIVFAAQFGCNLHANVWTISREGNYDD